MSLVKVNIPEPVENTYDIVGITQQEAEAICELLGDASGDEGIIIYTIWIELKQLLFGGRQ